MIKNKKMSYLINFQYEKLKSIGSIKFTEREIDVISCLMNGRTTRKSIAKTLNIEASTAAVHLTHLREKLNCSSWEYVREFIEKSEYVGCFQKHFFALIRDSNLIDLLKKIHIMKKNDLLILSIYYNDNIDKEIKNSVINYLNYSGFKINQFKNHFFNEEKIDDNIFLMFEEHSLQKKIFKIYETKSIEDLIIEILNFFCSKSDILKIISNFSLQPIDQQNTESIILPQKNKNEKKIFHLIIFSLICGFCFYKFFKVFNRKYTKINQYICQETKIPSNSYLLKRSGIIQTIYEKFSHIDFQDHHNRTISVVSLVGMGGVGKTTLARMWKKDFQHRYPDAITWEFNAQTKESLIESFNDFALSITKNSIVKSKIQSIHLKKTELINIVQNYLEQSPKWALIFDNVESISDVLEFIPQDPSVWGEGYVLITTRNMHINSININPENIIVVNELTIDEAEELFEKIICDKVNHCDKKENIKNLLTKIPLFPLDISVSGKYINDQKLSVNTYLEDLNNERNISHIEENLLKDGDNYKQTRSQIITLTIKNIIQKNKDFKKLFLIISFIDSQNIPLDLLEFVTNEQTANLFLYELKKHSLITDQTNNSNNQLFSIHRSTQKIIFHYFLNHDHAEFFTLLSKILENYMHYIIYNTNLIKMKNLIPHCKRFLSHQLIQKNNLIYGKLIGYLGIIYYFMNDNLESKKLLENSIDKLKKSSIKNQQEIACMTGYLGNVYRDLGDYSKASLLLKECVSIYQNHPEKRDHLKYGYFLAYSGIIEHYHGNYEKAKLFFEKGIHVGVTFFPENQNYFYWLKGLLGIIDGKFGFYKRAIENLENSLLCFRSEKSDVDISWALEHLGDFYIKQNQIQKARDALRESIQIYSLHLPDDIGKKWISLFLSEESLEKNNHEIEKNFLDLLSVYQDGFHGQYIYIAFPLKNLGILYGQIGKFEIAKTILEQVMIIYQKTFNDEHLEVGFILHELGKLYLSINDLKMAKFFFQRSLMILKKEKHPHQTVVSKELSEL